MNGSAYFNVDWLEDENLGLSTDVQLTGLGDEQPLGTPDLTDLMQDYLSGDVNWDTAGLFDYSAYLETTPFAEQEFEIGEQGSGTIVTGEELFAQSGAPGLLLSMDKYDRFKEENKRKSTIANISQSLNKIDSAQKLAERKTKAIQSIIGKTGFAGSGKMKKMQDAHYGDVSRTIKGMTGDIKKSILGYTSNVDKLRNKHIDDTWALYSDWLALDPEIGRVQGGSMEDMIADCPECIAHLIEDNYEVDEDTGIIDQDVTDTDEGWVNQTACAMSGGNMAPGGFGGGMYCDTENYSEYEEAVANIGNCDTNTWTATNGTCNPDMIIECEPNDPYCSPTSGTACACGEYYDDATDSMACFPC